MNRAKDLTRIVKVAQIGGIRLIEATAKTRIRSVQEVGEEAPNLVLSHGATLREGPDQHGIFYVVARMDAQVTPDDPKEEPFVSVSVTFELRYRLPEGFPTRKENLQEFARVNGIFNAWPYFREVIQTATARMNLPPVVIPLFRLPRAQPGKKSVRAPGVTKATASPR